MAPEPRAPWQEVGIHGLQRHREWDAVVVVDAEGPPGNELSFVSLPDGSLLVDDEIGGLDAFADALEGQVEPPYRAVGVRRGERRWALAARGIQVVELDADPGGDTVELAIHGGERTLLVDSARTFGTIPELEELLDGDGVVAAERLDANLWEVRVSPL